MPSTIISSVVSSVPSPLIYKGSRRQSSTGNFKPAQSSQNRISRPRVMDDVALKVSPIAKSAEPQSAPDSTAVVKTGEHTFEDATVRACVQYGTHRGQWIAEFRFIFRCGAYQAHTLPLSARSQHFATEHEAVCEAAKRLNASLCAMMDSQELPVRQARGLAKLKKWVQSLEVPEPNPPATEAVAPLRFLDCFAGIGGFHQALKGMGTVCAGAIEIDPQAQETYRANHSGDYPMFADIRQVKGDEFGSVDILCGGFPCQSFSVAGDDMGFNDPTHGALFFELTRLMAQAAPKMFILENVEGLAMNDNGKTYATVIDTLANLGYAVTSQVLDAANFGTAQHRERIFLVGVHESVVKDRTTPFEFPVGTDSSVVLADILQKFPNAKTVSIPMKRVNPDPTGPSQKIELVGYLNGRNAQSSRVASALGKSYTLCASSGSPNYLIKGKLRKLTSRECARLQGFPDSFKTHPKTSVARRQFGNSVAVPVVTAIAQRLIQAVSPMHAVVAKGGAV
jgi:DNA (cytosine-5)-methyltransferase 1